MSVLKSTLFGSIVLCGAMSASADDVFIDQAVVNFGEAAGQVGTLQVLVDTSTDGFTFADGSLGISVSTSTPGVIQITGAQVFEPEFFGGAVRRWSANGGNAEGVSADQINELLGVSVGTAGLDSAIPGNADGAGGTYVFAEITYQVIGEGTTEITLGEITSRQGAFIVNDGTDVSGSVNFGGSQINVVPEPGSLALLGLGGLALLRRRR